MEAAVAPTPLSKSSRRPVATVLEEMKQRVSPVYPYLEYLIEYIKSPRPTIGTVALVYTDVSSALKTSRVGPFESSPNWFLEHPVHDIFLD